MTRLDSSGSTMVARIEEGLLILVFVVSIGGIGVLTTRYVRSPSPTAYAFSGGSGELWLTVIAIVALAGFLIIYYDERHKERGNRKQREDSSTGLKA